MKQVIHRLSACIITIIILCIPSLAYADASGIANAAQRAQRICVPQDEDASASSSSSGATTQAPVNDNAKKLAQALADAGFSKASTAGLLGNIEQESHFNPTSHSSDGGWGIAQWTAESHNLEDGKQKMVTMAKSAGVSNPNADSIDDQIAALVGYIAVTPSLFINGKKLMNEAISLGLTVQNNDLYTSWILAEKPEDAALAWGAGYERPGSLQDSRREYAKKYYDDMLSSMTFTNSKVEDFKAGKLGGKKLDSSSTQSSASDDEEQCQEGDDVQAVINAYMDWAKTIAADKTHGYDQTHRTGPDYDCSSFVASALRSAGIDVSMFNTHTMEKELLDHHFIAVTDQVNLTTGEDLQNGDILWNDEHTEFSMGKDKTVGAHWNEHKTTTGGETGDQTDEEISESTLSKAGQQYKKAFRYIGNPDNATTANYLASGKGNCEPGSATCYGHGTGDTVGCTAYPARNCTLWACMRRHELKLPVGSYMGNGADWAKTGRNLGYKVNNTPQEGAVMVFQRGQRVTTWNADPDYGHVAIVEKVLPGNKVYISEGGTGFPTFPAYETVSNADSYEYVHY